MVRNGKLFKRVRYAELVSVSFQRREMDRFRNKFGMTVSVLLFSVLLLCGCISTFGANAPAQTSTPLPKLQSISTLSQQQQVVTVSPVQPQQVEFILCNKYFKMDSQKLFYLTLASINANRFQINEIKSKSGYVLFTAAQKQFLASVVSIDSKNSMLKVTPCSNVYFFPIGVVQNIFKYIELNILTPIEKLIVL